MTDERKRELGTIRKVRIHTEDHGIPTVSVDIEFDGSMHQGLGNLCMDKPGQAKYVEMLCATFGVKKPTDLIGKRCYGLRCFSHWNEYLEGVETLDGARFTHTDFRRALSKGKVKTPLESKRESLVSSIAHHERRIREMQRELETLEADYTPWSLFETHPRRRLVRP